MNIFRQNTDYAFRLLVALAQDPSKPISTRALAAKTGVPYQFASKIMQKLHGQGLVESTMGPQGGFRIGRPAEKVNLLEIIEVVQGPVIIKTCLLGEDACPWQENCPVSDKLKALQKIMDNYLKSITLADLVAEKIKLTRQKKLKEK